MGIDSYLLLSQQGHDGDLLAPMSLCITAEEDILACIDSNGSTGQTCWDCVFDIADDLFANGSNVYCTDIESVMCDAWQNQCSCSPCEDEWESWYLGCFFINTACGSMSCDFDQCESLLDEANNCLALAPPSCPDCINDAAAAIDPIISSVPCPELETVICNTTSEVCSCSPCEQELQDYFFCAAADWNCSDIGPCPVSAAEYCASVIADAVSCELDHNSTFCVECMDFFYNQMTLTNCTLMEDAFCQEIASATNNCNCHESCHDKVALAVSCGTDCDGMDCTAPPLTSEEECAEAQTKLNCMNECFVQCGL